MKRSDLKKLTEAVVKVEHNNLWYVLAPPKWDDYAIIQKHLMSMAQLAKENDHKVDTDDSTELMLLAVQATLRFDGDDEPPTRAEVQSILLHTGMQLSPVAIAALELCGIRSPENDSDDEDTDLPSGSPEQ